MPAEIRRHPYFVALLTLILVLTIVSTLQGRAVIIALATLIRAAGLVAARSAPEARAATIFLVVNLVTVLDGGEPRFHVIKLRRRNDVLRLRGENGLDLLL
jgi:hypothetical protein